MTRWDDWSAVVRETIQHYGGRKGRNLNNVIYEVWNEASPSTEDFGEQFGPELTAEGLSRAAGGFRLTWLRRSRLRRERRLRPSDSEGHSPCSRCNKMTGTRIHLTGEGNGVSGFATKEGNKIKILLANFDSQEGDFQEVPVTLNHFDNASYSYQENLLAGIGRSSTETVASGNLQKRVSLSPNKIILIELEKS